MPDGSGPVSRLAPQPLRLVLNWGRRYSLWVFNFGLACCAIEFIAAAWPGTTSSGSGSSRSRPARGRPT